MAGTEFVPPATLSGSWSPFVACQMQLVDNFFCKGKEYNLVLQAGYFVTQQVSIIQISVSSYIWACCVYHTICTEQWSIIRISSPSTTGLGAKMRGNACGCVDVDVLSQLKCGVQGGWNKHCVVCHSLMESQEAEVEQGDRGSSRGRGPCTKWKDTSGKTKALFPWKLVSESLWVPELQVTE